MAGGPSDRVKRESAQLDTSHDIVDTWRRLIVNLVVVAVIAASVWVLCTLIRFGIEFGAEFTFAPFHGHGGHGEHGGHGAESGLPAWHADYAVAILVGVILIGALLRGLLLQLPSWKSSEGDGMGRSLEAFHATYFNENGAKDRYAQPTIFEALRRAVLTVLTVGTGGSGGIEAPVVPIGENLGAWWSKVIGVVRPDDLRIYQMAGIAAAVATLLDAPMTAALFAAEVVYNARILYRTLMYSLIGAVVAYAMNNHFLDMQPLFSVPFHSHRYTPLEYAEVAVVALLISAPAGLGITALFTFLKKLISPLAPVAKPVVGAAVVAAIAMALWYGLGIEPQHVMGVSEHTIVQVIAGEGNPLLTVWWVLFVLVIAKAVATGFTLMAGGSAGALVPAMYMGGISGAGMFHLLDQFGLTTVNDPSIYVVAGLSSALVAVVQVPLAAIVFSMEVFGASFGPPAIVACVLTYKLARRWRLYLTPPPAPRKAETEAEAAAQAAQRTPDN
ncbi:MAG: chloride channel protein [Minwuia sp.]|uniref:chloride channel protein n=1 Tax=Minwuia sp. TaxID=2493630 RepID=UPI003A86DB31